MAVTSSPVTSSPVTAMNATLSVTSAPAPTLQDEANALLGQIQIAHDLLNTLLGMAQTPSPQQGGNVTPTASVAILGAREDMRVLVDRLHALVNSVGQL